MSNKSIVSKLVPLYDRVIVSRVAAQEESDGGIILPETAKEKPLEGKVLAVGKGRLHEDGKTIIPLAVKVGDHVLFAKWSGTEINLDGQEFLIMHEKDIIGIIKD